MSELEDLTNELNEKIQDGTLLNGPESTITVLLLNYINLRFNLVAGRHCDTASRSRNSCDTMYTIL